MRSMPNTVTHSLSSDREANVSTCACDFFFPCFQCTLCGLLLADLDSGRLRGIGHKCYLFCLFLLLFRLFCLFLLLFRMASNEMRRCPGVGGRECGIFMSPLFRDPHPTCSRCRGRSCSYKSTCKTCDGWSLDQWEHYRLKHAYAGRSKSSSRHAGNPIETASNPPLSPASTRSAPPSFPPPPPPSEGLGEGREAPSVVDIKEPRVSSPPSVPLQEQGEGGMDTPQVCGGKGDASATSLTSVGTTTTQRLPACGPPRCGHCPQGTRASILGPHMPLS